MARIRDERGTRYPDGGEYSDDDRERRQRRRHKEREYVDESSARQRERRERRRADEARREAELDIDEMRARRDSYYSRPESERRRDQARMAQEIRVDRAKESRSAPRELGRESSRRVRRKEVEPDDRSDEYVYSRPRSRRVVEELDVRRSSIHKRSDEGGSSSRTAYTPHSGSGSASLRRVDTSKLGRSMSARESGRNHASTRPTLRRTSTIKSPSPDITRTQSGREVSRRSTGGLFANLFNRPAARAPSTPVHKEPQMVDCLVCMNDELPVHKTVRLGCGHRMCHSCLRRQFTLSVQDPQHMPPRCCTSEHIPLKYAERLFDDKFKILWNKKYQEYTTANRLYCPTKGCGQWIKPSKIRMDLTYGRKYARCSACNTKVCVLCNCKFHTRRECPKDEETNRLVQMAKEQGWQRCYNCKAVVELKEGCNHMTCRCTAQFCMVCAAPWKTCSCPWFNYDHVEDTDRPEVRGVPYTTRQRDDVVEVVEIPEEPLVRRSSTRRHRSSRDRPRDRDLERADRTLAAHLQAQLNMESRPRASESRRANPVVEVYGLGNSMGHHMNDSYTMRPTANPPARTTTRASAPRPSFFSRRSAREAPAPVRVVAASAMAGLSRDGSKRGANRVGTWLSHVQVDEEAIATAPRNVEVDDWRCDGTMIGID